MSYQLIPVQTVATCPYCHCIVTARLDQWGTAQAAWGTCPHLDGFERLDDTLYARFTEDTKHAASRLSRYRHAPYPYRDETGTY